jgi:hypothetical protein
MVTHLTHLFKFYMLKHLKTKFVKIIFKNSVGTLNASRLQNKDQIVNAV